MIKIKMADPTPVTWYHDVILMMSSPCETQNGRDLMLLRSFLPKPRSLTRATFPWTFRMTSWPNWTKNPVKEGMDVSVLRLKTSFLWMARILVRIHRIKFRSHRPPFEKKKKTWPTPWNSVVWTKLDDIDPGMLHSLASVFGLKYFLGKTPEMLLISLKC